MAKLILIGLLFCTAIAHATESCGSRAVRLLSESKASDLSTHFVGGDKNTIAQLQALSANVGKLSDFEAVDSPRFINHLRLSVMSPGMARAFEFASFRVNAVSERLGPVQVQVAVRRGSECEILAIHVDQERRI
jgi:hypothetical protein